MRNTIISFIIIIYLAVNCFAAQSKLVVPDDYPTVQEAIDAATAGDTVEIKPGEYEVEAIVLKDGVSLVGEGMDKVTIWNDANCGEHVILADRPQGAIRDLTVAQRGKNVSGKVLAGIFIVGSSVEVSNCRVRNADDHGIVVKDRSNSVIRNCVLESNGSCGIYVYGEGAEPILKNNKCSENKINGIYFKNGAGGIAKENICDKNGLHGISVVHKWTSPNLKNNQCLGNQGSGIYFGEGAKGIAENNICKENQWHGISIADDSSAPELRGNQCLNNKRCGIYYSEGAHITAKGNILKNNGEINFRQLRRVLWAEKFDELEETASKLRTEKRLFSNGNSQLQWFYHSLGEKWTGYKPSVEDKLFGILNRWIEKKPESISPRIVMAKAYMAFAWHARGGKFARDVPEYAWDIFHEKLKKAWKVLTEAEKLKEKDPELYHMFLRAGMGLNKSDKKMDLFLKKGIKIDKTYYHLYKQRAISLLPRWGGLHGQLKQFAEQSAELNKGEDGEILYAKIIGEVATMYRNLGPDSFIELGFSYPRAKQGHIYILKKYPEAGYYLNTYCLLASIYKDKETAKGLFERIGDNWDKNVWCKEEYFRKYQTWAYGPETNRYETGKGSKSSLGRFLEYLKSKM